MHAEVRDEVQKRAAGEGGGRLGTVCRGVRLKGGGMESGEGLVGGRGGPKRRGERVGRESLTRACV